MESRLIFIMVPTVSWSEMNYTEYKHTSKMWINGEKIVAIAPAWHNDNYKYSLISLQGYDRDISVDMTVDEVVDLLHGISEL